MQKTRQTRLQQTWINLQTQRDARKQKKSPGNRLRELCENLRKSSHKVRTVGRAIYEMTNTSGQFECHIFTNVK